MNTYATVAYHELPGINISAILFRDPMNPVLGGTIRIICDGNIITEIAKIIGITPAVLTFMGRNDEPP